MFFSKSKTYLATERVISFARLTSLQHKSGFNEHHLKTLVLRNSLGLGAVTPDRVTGVLQNRIRCKSFWRMFQNPFYPK